MSKPHWTAPRREEVVLVDLRGRPTQKHSIRAIMAVPEYKDNTKLLASKQQIDLKNEGEADALSVAKDRGQVTMTSAMSMTNIALLKAVLDRGPKDNQFYVALLVLTCVAIGLQILAGILSLCVSQLRNYYQKFHDKLRPSVQCCPVRLICRDTPATNCCPCRVQVVSHYYSDYELGIIDEWKEWVVDDTEQDMNAVEASIMVAYLDEKISGLREKLENVREDMENAEKKEKKSKEEYQLELEQIRTDIDYELKKKALYIDVKKKSESSNAKGDILSTAVHDITRNHTLKRAQTWQYVINLMLYSAFIISAFLTGLGLAA